MLTNLALTRGCPGLQTPCQVSSPGVFTFGSHLPPSPSHHALHCQQMPGPCPGQRKDREQKQLGWTCPYRPGMSTRKDHRIQTSKPTRLLSPRSTAERPGDREIAHDCRGHDHFTLHSHFSLCLDVEVPCLLEEVEAEEQSCSPEPQWHLSTLQGASFHVSVRMGTKSRRHPAQGLPGLSFPKHSKATVLTGPQGPT